jgi:hypothetical protein
MRGPRMPIDTARQNPATRIQTTLRMTFLTHATKALPHGLRKPEVSGPTLSYQLLVISYRESRKSDSVFL